jgi:ferric-dicitrate binding protein FerR (iron transport regulator)
MRERIVTIAGGIFVSMSHRAICRASVVFLAVFWATVASPQSANLGCNLEQRADASRQVLRCPGGVRITPEDGARYSLADRDQDGNADGVILRRKALLLEVPTGQTSGFVVVTPQAIAAVRGTKWAVDAQSGKTSVFVVDGRVGVQRPSSSASVLLGPGEGVDVERGTTPLTVRRWPAARVSALMARLGE